MKREDWQFGSNHDLLLFFLLKAHPNFRETRAPRQTSRKMGSIEFPITLEPWPHGTWSYDVLCWFVGCQDGTMWFDDIWLMIIVGDISLAGYPTIHWLIISVLCSWFFNGNWGEKIHDINDYNKLTPMSLEMMVSIQGNYPPMTLFLFSVILITVYIFLEWP